MQVLIEGIVGLIQGIIDGIQFMIDMIMSVIDTIVSIFAFAGNMLESLFRLLTNIPKMVSMLMSAISFVPAQYLTFMTATVAVAVMFFITGKER